jgi:hypothetical protein
VARRKGTELSVFKGREAKLNRAIFQALALEGPQTIYDIHKRVRFLEKSGYVRRIGARKTKAGFEAHEYEPTAKAYLVLLLNSISLEELLSRLDETGGNEILAGIIARASY